MRFPGKFLTLKHKNPRTYPIGTHTWALGNDNAMCAMDKDDLVWLSFSTCFPNKYTCNTGECIDLRYLFSIFIIKAICTVPVYSISYFTAIQSVFHHTS